MKTDYTAIDEMAELAVGRHNGEAFEFEIEELESRIAFEAIEGGCCGGCGAGSSCGSSECTGY